MIILFGICYYTELYWDDSIVFPYLTITGWNWSIQHEKQQWDWEDQWWPKVHSIWSSILHASLMEGTTVMDEQEDHCETNDNLRSAPCDASLDHVLLNHSSTLALVGHKVGCIWCSSSGLQGIWSVFPFKLLAVLCHHTVLSDLQASLLLLLDPTLFVHTFC